MLGSSVGQLRHRHWLSDGRLGSYPHNESVAQIDLIFIHVLHQLPPPPPQQSRQTRQTISWQEALKFLCWHRNSSREEKRKEDIYPTFSGTITSVEKKRIWSWIHELTICSRLLDLEVDAKNPNFAPPHRSQIVPHRSIPKKKTLREKRTKNKRPWNNEGTAWRINELKDLRTRSGQGMGGKHLSFIPQRGGT